MNLKIKFTSLFLLQIAMVSVAKLIIETNSSSKKSPEFKIAANRNSSHIVKSIQSEDGDIIECIDIYKQPAFSHPALKNHRLQMVPTYDPKIGATSGTKALEEVKKGKHDYQSHMTKQLWKRSGSCPDGTIPIRKMQAKHFQKQSSNDNHNRKKPRFLNHDKQSEDGKEVKLLLANHSLAILHTEGFAYYGAKGDIMVWNPPVEKDDEYTTSHVALQSGPHGNYEDIEAGWAVNPGVYGDRQTRLYVYWTVDGSKETGCFDTTCPGFVQTSKEIALGAAIYPISSTYGLPSQISIFIHKDPYTRNWWVRYQNIDIGYWPSELFSLLRYHAVTVQWGGEVYSTRVGTHPHTATGMGNGRYPDVWWWNSGSVVRMRVLQNGGLVKPYWVGAYSDEYNCYDVYLIKEFVPEPEFLYGGPGSGDPRCP